MQVRIMKGETQLGAVAYARYGGLPARARLEH